MTDRITFARTIVEDAEKGAEDALAEQLRSLGFAEPEAASKAVRELLPLLSDGELSQHAADVLLALADAPDPDQALLLLANQAAADLIPIRSHLIHPEHRRNLVTLLGASRFLAQRAFAQPQLYALVDGPDIGKIVPSPEPLWMPEDDDDAVAALQQQWMHGFFTAGLLDLLGTVDVESLLIELSSLADFAINAALSLAHRQLARAHGKPSNRAESPACCVMALGKQGGMEVNVSSDLDLVFLYESERGETLGGEKKRPLSYPEFYTRLVHGVTRILEGLSQGGPYRVDLRLRPAGSKGDAATSVDSAVAYYQYFGQTWERQVWMRGRPCAGRIELGRRFLDEMEPFVYRKGLDWKDIADLRNLREKVKARAERETGFNVKLGSGGIREIEFVAQSFQLIFGGRRPEIRGGRTPEQLIRLSAAGLLPDEDAEGLIDSYRFWRKLENALQWADGLQTHKVPDSPRQRAALAAVMGYDGEAKQRTAALEAAMQKHGDRVSAVFDSLLFSWENDHDLNATFISPVQTQAPPQDDGVEEQSGAVAEFMQVAESTPNAVRARKNLDRLTDVYGAGSMDALLLDKKATGVLARLLAGSDYLGRVLVAAPELLDALFEPDELLLEKSADDYRALLSATGGDAAAVGEVVRQQQLRIGLRRILHQAGPVETMREASWLAWETVRALAEPRDLTVIALGALAGGEMVFTSDLDIVLAIGSRDAMDLYDAAGRARAFVAEVTKGQPDGPGFEVDLRLRPFGDQGPLVASGRRVCEYLGKEAAAWERAAYLRAGVVCGDAVTVEQIREAALARGLDDNDRTNLIETRGKGLAQRGSPEDLKWGPGGLADIELLVSMRMLTYGSERPDLPTGGTVAALGNLVAAGLLDQGKGDRLAEAAIFIKDLEHYLRTLFERPVTAMPHDPEKIEEIAAGMNLGNGDALLAKLSAMRSDIKRITEQELGIEH